MVAGLSLIVVGGYFFEFGGCVWVLIQVRWWRVGRPFTVGADVDHYKTTLTTALAVLPVASSLNNEEEKVWCIATGTRWCGFTTGVQPRRRLCMALHFPSRGDAASRLWSVGFSPSCLLIFIFYWMACLEFCSWLTSGALYCNLMIWVQQNVWGLYVEIDFICKNKIHVWCGLIEYVGWWWTTLLWWLHMIEFKMSSNILPLLHLWCVSIVFINFCRNWTGKSTRKIGIPLWACNDFSGCIVVVFKELSFSTWFHE